MGKFLNSVLKRPSRSYATEASYPWDGGRTERKHVVQTGSDLGVRPSRRRTASLFSNDSEPGRHHHLWPDRNRAQPRPSFAGRQRPSPVEEEPNSSSAKPSKGVLFDGDLPALPPQHQDHILFGPEASVDAVPQAQIAENAQDADHSDVLPQRSDLRPRSRRPESEPPRPEQLGPQPGHSPPHALNTRPADAHHKLNGAAVETHPRSQPLHPEEYHGAESRTARRLSHPQSTTLALPVDPRIATGTHAITPPSARSRTLPPLPLHLPGPHAPEALEHTGPTAPRVVQFANVVEYSDTPCVYSDEDTESHYSQESHSSDERPSITAPDTPPRPHVQTQGGVPPVPPRSPKRGSPGARRDSVDSVSSPTARTHFGGALLGTPPAPLVPLPEVRAQPFHKASGDSLAGDRPPSKHSAHDGGDDVDHTIQLSRQAGSHGAPVPKTRAPAAQMLSNLQTPEAHSQQVSVDNSPMTKPEAILTPAHSSLQSIPSSDTNSSTGSVPDTVLMSPDFPAATRDSAPTQAVVEPSSKRASLVLDDAASEKSVYYTPRNSFYLNRNGSASISTLVLDKIGEGQRTTDDEEPFEMPGAWTWGAIETPSKSMSEHIPNVFSEDHGEIPVEQALDQNKPAEPPASAAPVIVESFACVQPIDTPALPAAQEAPASSTLPTLPTSHGASDEGLVMDHESDSGSFEITERSGVEPPAEAICTSAQAGTMSDEPSEKTGTPHVHFSELPTFHLQPPTPATLTDVRVGCLPDLDSRPLHGEPGLPEGTQVSVVRALSSTAPLSPAMSASNVYLDDEIDLDSFAPEEIAYYNPCGPADPVPESAGRSRVARVASHDVPRPLDDTQRWSGSREKTKLLRTASLVRRQTSKPGVDTPPTSPTKSKQDRGGRVSGAFVQVLNPPASTSAVSAERGSKTRAAAMVDSYTSSLQRSNSKRSVRHASSLQRSTSKQSVRSVKSTRLERSSTVSSHHTIIPDRPERHKITSGAVSSPPLRQPRHALSNQAPSTTKRPISPESTLQPEPDFRDVQRSSLAYEVEGYPSPGYLSPPGSMWRSSSAHESPRQSVSMGDWHDAQQDAHSRSSARSSSDISAPHATGQSPQNRAVTGQGGWAAAAAEPIKMYVPTDGDGWSAFQPLPPRSRATPLPGSRNSSFDLDGRSSPSAASSSIAQSASGSAAGASQSSRMHRSSFPQGHSMVFPTSSTSGRVPRSRRGIGFNSIDADDSDEGERPSRSYASPDPAHPANVDPRRPAHADANGAHLAGVGCADCPESHDNPSEHLGARTSPAHANGHVVTGALFDRKEYSKAPSGAPSSRSSQYSTPSIYSAASAPCTRLNSPLPALPDDPSPYEAAARAHAARLGLASGLNPNVLTVLPEMSVQDSNQLYLPQRRNSRKLGSSSSDLGARGNMAPKQSASLLYARRYSCAASDMGQTAQMYASSELAPPLDTGDLNRRHSFNPRPSSLGSRNEVPRARSRTQSVRVPSRIGDSTHDDLVAPSNGTGVISLDTPSGRPLNNFPLMESNAYDQTQQSGYTNMVLPKGGNFKPGDPAKANRLDLQLLGVPPTSMGAVTLSSALHSYHLKHQSPTPEHLRWTLPPPVDFSTITPPHQVSRAQILIQVYAVAVDWLDIAALDEKSKHDVGRWVPGRSFVGRCITTGADEKEIGRGDMVIGLVDIRHSGALAEYIVTDRRRVARVNRDTRLELEELAALPAQGIAVHRAIRDVGVIRGQQALVMDAHEGLPALFCQELTRMGLVVTAIVPGGVEKAQGDALACGARGVLVGSPSTVMHGLPENLFALVVDTAGAADAARRILIDGGHVLSLKSGVGPAQRRTLKTKLGLGKRKNVSVSYIQPAGAGEPAVDASGLDYRDVLEEPVLGVLRPSVEEVVPFELGASVFTSRRNMDRLRVAVVQIVN